MFDHPQTTPAVIIAEITKALVIHRHCGQRSDCAHQTPQTLDLRSPHCSQCLADICPLVKPFVRALFLASAGFIPSHAAGSRHSVPEDAYQRIGRAVEDLVDRERWAPTSHHADRKARRVASA